MQAEETRIEQSMQQNPAIEGQQGSIVVSVLLTNVISPGLQAENTI